mgnify:CR=1 FL=1
MTTGAERLLVLSIRLLKTAANPKFGSERKGVILQKLSGEREKTLHEISLDRLSAADKARIEIAAYFGHLAAQRVKAEL